MVDGLTIVYISIQKKRKWNGNRER